MGNHCGRQSGIRMELFPGMRIMLFTIWILAVIGAVSGGVKAASPQGQPALPAAGAYKIDPVHSFAFFSAWHHIVGVVRGRFEKVTGTITVSKALPDCSVDVSIDTASVTTQNSERDEDLRGPDFFDAGKYPAMEYHGRGLHPGTDGALVLDGNLTIRGITRPVPLLFTYKGIFPDTPAGKPARVAFHGTAHVRRGDFGMTRDNLMELGPSPKGPDVDIEIDVEADAISPVP